MVCEPHLVVGICGRSGAGKSTLAARVKEFFHHVRRDVPVVRRSFAQPLKEMLEHVGVGKAHPLYREAAQRIGTEFFRDRDPEFWVRIAQDSIRSLSRPSVVVIDDVRFLNESAAVDLLVRLHTRRPSTLTVEQLCHVSERLWERMTPHLEFQNDDEGTLNEAVDATAARILELWGAA